MKKNNMAAKYILLAQTRTQTTSNLNPESSLTPKTNK